MPNNTTPACALRWRLPTSWRGAEACISAVYSTAAWLEAPMATLACCTCACKRCGWQHNWKKMLPEKCDNFFETIEIHAICSLLRAFMMYSQMRGSQVICGTATFFQFYFLCNCFLCTAGPRVEVQEAQKKHGTATIQSSSVFRRQGSKQNKK